MTVLNREGQHLGVVSDLIPTGPHSVLRLQRPDTPPGAPPEEAERLIPFVDAYVDQVDPARRVITVDWGLDY
jgi:16S rRNA processing protein RimM